MASAFSNSSLTLYILEKLDLSTPYSFFVLFLVKALFVALFN